MIPEEHLDEQIERWYQQFDDRDLDFPNVPTEIPTSNVDLAEVRLIVIQPRYGVDALKEAQRQDGIIGVYLDIMNYEKREGREVTYDEKKLFMRRLTKGQKDYFQKHRDDFKFVDEVLVAVRNGRNLVVAPQLYHFQIMFQMHNTMGHRAVESTLERVRSRFDWPDVPWCCGKAAAQPPDSVRS